MVTYDYVKVLRLFYKKLSVFHLLAIIDILANMDYYNKEDIKEYTYNTRTNFIDLRSYLSLIYIQNKVIQEIE